MTNSTKPPFASKLKSLRTQRGLSQTQVAEQLGTDFRVISRWERGLHLPTAYYRPKLCELFGMTLDELGLAKPLPVVFLSYASAEQKFVEQLKLDLEKREIAVWVNKEGEISNVANREDLCKTFKEEVQAMILIASPNAHDAYTVKQELEIAELCKCPVRVLWVAGERRRDAIPPDQSAARFIDAVDVRDNASYDAAIDKFIDNLSQLFVPTDGPETFHKQPFEPRKPYKGLQAFHEDEKNDFFGRDRLTDELADELERILASGDKARLLAVVGHSGSGKSSVVMAGLLPLLQQGELAGSQEWIYLDPMTPGTDPIETLALRLMQHLPERSIESINKDLIAEKASGLHLLASVIAKQPNKKVVLIVDQFEELFTQTADEQTRTQFINLLVKACQMPDGPLLVILTLRADFYHKLMYHEELGKIIEKQSKLVFPMSAREIKAVIERPTLLPDVRVTFESNLVEDLLSEVKGQTGALPLLQFTLDQLFERRNGLQLTYAAYEAIGKVEGALAHYADQIYDSLDEDEKQRMRNILLQMVQPGNGVADTRRMARRSEIGEEDWELVLRLANQRLIVINTTTDGQEIAEIAHEALIQNWQRLQDWMKVDRSFRAWQERLRSALRQWEENSQDIGGLLRGMPLAEAKRWFNERDQQIKGKERDFLFQSILLEGSELQEWVPKYGTVEATLAFIKPYTSSDEQKKLISIDALRWLPHTGTDDEVYDLLLNLALEDLSLTVRKKATQCICERGHTVDLAQLLAPNKLPKQKKQRLTKSLASVRNIPKVGYQVEKALRYSKRRILFAAMLELIYTYRNQFAIILFFSYIIGQMLLSFVNMVFSELLSLIYHPSYDAPTIDIPTLVGDIFRIVMTLAICLYIKIRRNHIDGKRLSIKQCVIASLYFILFFDTIYILYNFALYIFVTHGTLLSTQSISLIVSPLLPDAIALPIIAQVLRTNLGTRGAIWKLLWIALVSMGLLIVIERILIPQISFLAEETAFFTSKSISYDFFAFWQSFYHMQGSYQSILATLVVGVFAGFGSVLGFRFGFLSAFNSENKAKPHPRLSVMTLLSRKRQKEPTINRMGSGVNPLYILRALPKSFYIVILLILPGPIFASGVVHSLPRPLSSYSPNPAGWYCSSYSGSPGVMAYWYGTSTTQQDISFSPNGKFTAFGRGGAIAVLNTMTGEILYEYRCHPTLTGDLSEISLNRVVWSPDSTKLTATFKYSENDSSRANYQEETWDAKTGKTLYVLPVHYKDYSTIQWSPNSKYIAGAIDDASSNRSIEVWDATTGASVNTYHSHSFYGRGIIWSPDSTQIISAFDSTIEVWDVISGKALRTVDISADPPSDSINWSPSGKYIGVLSYFSDPDHMILGILDATSFKVLYTRSVLTPKSKIYWSPDSKYIAITTHIGVEVWDVLSGKRLYTYLGHIQGSDDTVGDIAWSSDSRRIASAGIDGSLQVWDATTGNNVNTYYPYPTEANYWNIIIGKDHVSQIGQLIEVNWAPNSNNIATVICWYSDDCTIYDWQIT